MGGGSVRPSNLKKFPEGWGLSDILYFVELINVPGLLQFPCMNSNKETSSNDYMDQSAGSSLTFITAQSSTAS